MSALPRYQEGGGFAGLRMQAGEFLALGPTPDRLELLDGVVLMSPSPSYWHQLLTGELFLQLARCRDNGAKFRVIQGIDIRFGPMHVYCPDISVFADDPKVMPSGALESVPDLAIETLSPSNRGLDLVTKRQDYEKFGVREYWVIDPHGVSVRRWARRGGVFADLPVHGDLLESEAVPGVIVDLAALRRGYGT